MIAVSIKEFARSGQFGPITLGMTRASLQALLGDPDCWGAHDATSVDTADIWKYGDIEFYLDHSILYMIYADSFFDVLHGGSRILIDPWVVRMCLDAAVFKDALESADISYSVETLPSYLPGEIEIKTIGNVVFRFRMEAEDEFDRLGLSGFSLCKKGE